MSQIYSIGNRAVAVTADNTSYITGFGWVAENGTATTPTSATIASDLFTLVGNGLANGDQLVIDSLGTITGTGLAINAIVFVVGVSGDTFQLSLTYGGSAIDLGGANTTPITYRKIADFQSSMRLEGCISVTTSGTYRVLPAWSQDTDTTTVNGFGAQDIYIAAGIPYPMAVKKVFSTGSAATTGISCVLNS
jgi:hypothetical protein